MIFFRYMSWLTITDILLIFQIHVNTFFKDIFPAMPPD